MTEDVHEINGKVKLKFSSILLTFCKLATQILCEVSSSRKQSWPENKVVWGVNLLQCEFLSSTSDCCSFLQLPQKAMLCKLWYKFYEIRRSGKIWQWDLDSIHQAINYHPKKAKIRPITQRCQKTTFFIFWIKRCKFWNESNIVLQLLLPSRC